MTKRLGQQHPFMFAIFSAIGFLGTRNQATADSTFKSVTCNGNLFSVWSEEKVLPQVVVNAIVDHTPTSVGVLTPAEETRKDWFGKEHGSLYGLGFCSAGMLSEDCADCLKWARKLLFDECSKRGVGAQIHLQDCDIRYETYPITDVRTSLMDVVVAATAPMTQEAEPPPTNAANATPAHDDPRIQHLANGVLKRHPPRGLGSPEGHLDLDVSYKECLKNHAATMGGYALDGCREFMPSPSSSLTCDACGCHRNFHRRCLPEDTLRIPAPTPMPRPASPNPTRLIDFQPVNRQQPPPPVAVIPLAAAAPPRSPGSPSPPPISLIYYSSGMTLPTAPRNAPGRRSGQQKRFRTKFSHGQKERMLEFAERIGWRMQRSELGNVREFCQGIGVDRNVFKVWMHNNKNTLGKKMGGGVGIVPDGAIGDFPKDDDGNR